MEGQAHHLIGSETMRAHDIVVLSTDIPEHGLREGDMGTVVLEHKGSAGYEVEFATVTGGAVTPEVAARWAEPALAR